MGLGETARSETIQQPAHLQRVPVQVLAPVSRHVTPHRVYQPGRPSQAGHRQGRGRGRHHQAVGQAQGLVQQVGSAGGAGESQFPAISSIF